MPANMSPFPFERRSEAQMRERASGLLAEMATRRSCRAFSDEPVPRDVIETVVAVGHSAPSGANRKPWRFVVIGDPEIKKQIRHAAEAEEHANYDHRFPAAWLEALEPLGTDAHKPFLETAPWLVVLFRIDWEEMDGKRVPNYYPAESTGIAAGMFLTACHLARLATLTHTPSPMGFLRRILNRPPNEKPYLVIPVGYPAANAMAPDIPRKPLREALQWDRGDG